MSSKGVALAIAAAVGAGAPAVRDLRRDVDAVAAKSLPAVETNTRNLAGPVIPLAEDIHAADLPTLRRPSNVSRVR